MKPSRVPLVLLASCVVALVVACGGSRVVTDLPAARGALGTTTENARLRLLDDYDLWLGPVRVKNRRGRTRATAPAEPGWCYAYFAVGGDGVRDLDMEVFGADGRSLGTDTMFDTTPFVQHCATRTETVEIVVRVTRGRGQASLSVLRKPD